MAIVEFHVYWRENGVGAGGFHVRSPDWLVAILLIALLFAYFFFRFIDRVIIVWL